MSAKVGHLTADTSGHLFLHLDGKQILLSQAICFTLAFEAERLWRQESLSYIPRARSPKRLLDAHPS